MPSARPFADDGATRDTSDGRLASSTLKPTKNSSSQPAIHMRLGAWSSRPSWTTSSRPTADRNRTRMRDLRSAAMIGGIIRPNDTSTTGR